MPRIPVSWLFPTLVAFSLFLRLLAPSFVYAGVNRWTSNGPNLPAVQTLAITPTSPQIVYAGADRGLFKSTDGGLSWVQRLNTDSSA